MKKILFIAATIAAISACSKGIDTAISETDSPFTFVKGQKVTLCGGTSDLTKASNAYDSDSKTINFKWAAGDSIKVSVESASSIFTVSKLIDDGASAEFTGTMPASGDNFDVQFPVTDPDLSTQTYCATEAIPHNMMKFTATGCTLGTDFSLAAANAVLKLNLYGIDRKVSQIVVTNYSSYSNPRPTYTLAFNDAVKLSNSKDSPSPFFIVVPTNESGWVFQAEMTLSEVIPSFDGNLLKNYENDTIGKGIVIGNARLATTDYKFFTAGSVLNMPAQSVTTVWAPVNCGYDATNYPMGLLYQWGRKYGQAYETGTITTTTMKKSDDTEANKEYVGKTNGNTYNWYIGAVDNTLWNGATKGKKDPCPEGWRVPTISELSKLFGGDGVYTLGLGNFEISWDSVNKGQWLNGTRFPSVGVGLFLPAAGYRDSSGYTHDRGTEGYYWSSSVCETYRAWHIWFYNNAINKNNYTRDMSYSVRCVQE